MDKRSKMKTFRYLRIVAKGRKNLLKMVRIKIICEKVLSASTKREQMATVDFHVKSLDGLLSFIEKRRRENLIKELMEADERSGMYE